MITISFNDDRCARLMFGFCLSQDLQGNTLPFDMSMAEFCKTYFDDFRAYCQKIAGVDVTL